MDKIRAGNPGVGVNFAPYLRNRYDEMREIPYEERTEQQRDEKDRLLKQMMYLNWLLTTMICALCLNLLDPCERK